jgi:5'-nucleotidase
VFTIRKALAVAMIFAMTAMISACGGGSGSSSSDTPVQVKILHMNDSHSHIEGDTETLEFDGVETDVTMGGMARAAALIDSLRDENTLLLHAGDTVQGTLYYTLFDGEADADVLNAMDFDAIAIGNHEFDDGDDFLSSYIDIVDAPFISANAIPTMGNTLYGKFDPYIIKTVNDQKIGIIGLTIAGKTKDSSSPSDEITFLDETTALQNTVNELKNLGVQKIVVLSHYGYTNVQAMAAQVTDIDVIVDGDSHTLLGDFAYVGLASSGDYPTMALNADGDDVCIVQAWEYGKAVGELNVTFDGDAVESCSGDAHLIISDDFEQDDATSLARAAVSDDVRASILAIISGNGNIAVIPDADVDQSISTIVDTYSGQVDALSAEVIGEAAETIYLGRVPGKDYNGANLPLGSEIAPIVAKAFYDLSNRADMCIQNAGGVRQTVNAGDITYGTAYTLLPFGNTLYEIEMYGSEIKQVLEDSVEGIAQGGSDGGFPYSYALKYDVDATQAYGSRFSNLEVKDRTTGTWSALDDETMYVVVTNSYTASGKDGYTTFGTVQAERGPGVDTYLDYAMSFVAYVQALTANGDQLEKLPAEDHPVKSYVELDPAGKL